MSEDFYVGYQARAPRPLARLLWWVAILVTLLAAGLAIGIATEQRNFGAGTFEFGVERTLEGTLIDRPYPALRVARPGSTEHSLVLLTRFGKHAYTPPPELVGRQVAIAGQLIHRGRRTMLEVGTPPLDLGPGTVVATEPLGRLTVVGEIVDAKCWLGVMKPNEGVLHRACAQLCLRGGAPALLRVVDGEGRVESLLLVGPDGGPLGPELLDLVAIPVEVSGALAHLGGETFSVTTSVDAIRPLGPDEIE